MTIKLPIILSAMIAALAVPGTLASEAGTEAPKSEAAAPTGAKEKKSATDSKGMGNPPPHTQGHQQHHNVSNSTNPPAPGYEQPLDSGNVLSLDNDPNVDNSPKVKGGEYGHPGKKAKSR
jgi:hypothetical protein